MIAPIAAVIFATAMALSLSVEAESFFHTPTKAAAEANQAKPATSADDAAQSGERGAHTARSP